MAGRLGQNTAIGGELSDMVGKQDGQRTQQVRQTTGTIIAYGTYGAETSEETSKSSKPSKKMRAVTTSTYLKYFRKGLLFNDQDGLYMFVVRTDKGEITTFLPLTGKADSHAGDKGAPSKMLGSKCNISYRGPSVNRGQITDLSDDSIDPLTVGATNQLPITGVAFAPPGNGLI